MTREEAIRVLSKEACENFSRDFAYATDMAISALREQEERSKGCERCRDATYTEKPFEVTTQRGVKLSVQFHHCPNCGRNLEVAG